MFQDFNDVFNDFQILKVSGTCKYIVTSNISEE